MGAAIFVLCYMSIPICQYLYVNTYLSMGLAMRVKEGYISSGNENNSNVTM